MEQNALKIIAEINRDMQLLLDDGIMDMHDIIDSVRDLTLMQRGILLTLGAEPALFQQYQTEHFEADAGSAETPVAYQNAYEALREAHNLTEEEIENLRARLSGDLPPMSDEELLGAVEQAYHEGDLPDLLLAVNAPKVEDVSVIQEYPEMEQTLKLFKDNNNLEGFDSYRYLKYKHGLNAHEIVLMARALGASPNLQTVTAITPGLYTEIIREARELAAHGALKSYLRELIANQHQE